MTDPAALAADPNWLPHRIDLSAKRVMFLRIERRQTAEHGFLADIESTAEQAWMSLDDYAAARCETGAVHFVFHTGLCCSTLLIRALNLPGTSVGLNEPGILNSLVQIGPHAESLLRPTLDLLSRPHAAGEPTVIKPSNYANSLIEPILAARSSVRVVLMTDALRIFLVRLARRGLAGRVWGRQVFLEALRFAGQDLSIAGDARAAMSDLQAAALGWFVMQRHFAALLRGPHKDRVRSLHGERFKVAPAAGLIAVGTFFGLELDAREAEAVSQGPVFAKHSKLDSKFEATDARAAELAASPIIEEEIAEVEQWIAALARQAGTTIPVPQSLM